MRNAQTTRLLSGRFAVLFYAVAEMRGMLKVHVFRGFLHFTIGA